MPLSDVDLMLATKEGDDGAFAELVHRYQRPLVNYFRHQLWNVHTAEDLAQEVFLRLHKHADRYEPRALFRTFLFRIARNLWIDHVRGRGAGPRVVSLDVTSEGANGSSSLGENLAGGEETPQQKLSRNETQQIVRRALEHLPEVSREVILLGELQGLRYAEVAEILEIPVGTVKSRMFTAVRQLKRAIEEITGGEIG